MRRSTLLLAFAMAIALVSAVTLSHGGEEVSETAHVSEATTSSLPSSLNSLFPPKAEGPAFYLKMLEMNIVLSGIVSDLFEEDVENARANFERFKIQYDELTKQIPEWKERFPVGPVDELGAALGTGDPGKVMPAVEKVGAVCHACHTANMVAVQQKYHWGDFSAIMVDDPLTQKEVGFRQFKQFLAANFAGVVLDVAQGQQKNAQKQLEGFNARFNALRASCTACHDTERKYYVDDGMQKVIDELNKTLGESPIDGKRVGELIQNIGANSCSSCHRVHMPAVFADF